LLWVYAVSNIFWKATKVPSSHMLYVARQEGLRMTEELFQDGVKQVASAYGSLINNAKAGKDDTLQYLMTDILKMLQSTLPLE
jgi:hypothetical protein